MDSLIVGIDQVPISELKPFEGNPRKISDAGLEKLQRSIEEFGFTNPVLIQKGSNMIIAGHQRVKAAQAAGLATVSAITLDMDDATAKAYNVADNRLNQESTWDDNLLCELLRELGDIDIDLTVTGFDLAEIEDLVSMPDFAPVSEVEQPRLDEKFEVVCPSCGHEFAP